MNSKSSPAVDEDLAKRRFSLEEVLHAVPFAALAIDHEERIIAENDEAKKLIGRTALGRNYIIALRQPAMIETVEATLQDGAPRSTRFLSSENEKDVTFRVSCSAIGHPRIALLFFEDITDVEQAGQMRRDFVGNVSHELRTPLTSLMGFIETLRGPARNDPEAAMRFLDIMQDEAERMKRLIGDLMSLNRVEGDERVRPTSKTDLGPILHSSLRSLSHYAKKAEVTLESQIDDTPLWLHGDPDQLMQVFVNLIENAIKYGGGGRVTLHTARQLRDPALRLPSIRVKVVDYGPGIDPRHLPRLTERFYRADDHRSRALGGTGLGLAITKHIINRHRGRLKIESELGKGSCFTVILPAFEAEDLAANPAP